MTFSWSWGVCVPRFTCCAWKSAEASKLGKIVSEQKCWPQVSVSFGPCELCRCFMDCLHCAQLRGRQIQKIIFSYCEYSHIYLECMKKKIWSHIFHLNVKHPNGLIKAMPPNHHHHILTLPNLEPTITWRKTGKMQTLGQINMFYTASRLRVVFRF